MPKSGSSFLVESLLELTGFERCNPLAAGYRQENDLYEPALIDAIGRDTVAQIHVRASDHNVDLMTQYAWRPIVLIRHLPDVIVSLRDHILQEGPLWSMVWLDDRFAHLSDSEQLDLLVDLAAPWFVQFFVSWSEVTNAGVVDPLWINYADWVGEPAHTLAAIVEWADLDVTNEQIAPALDRARHQQTRLNVGRSGRGAEILSQAQLSRLRGFARHYPHLDFSPIGL